ncbi:MAG TPA: dNTP triphosphohydrolase [Solirubrobacteraceae bacterium]|jgi:dGTPase|nr:dNTP triphosphohydrolase [Solirubrobacteraceae bacterium]
MDSTISGSEGSPLVDGYDEQDCRRLRGQPGDDERSPFARDLDRLIYTPAFRRLEGKTQVAPAGEADFFRTRLTHTLEVAQVGRRLAESINRRADAARVAAGTSQWIDDPAAVRALPAEQQKVDPDLVEAAAVLHDLGHPPFAHVGEEALNDAVEQAGAKWGLPETGGFNGNAQSFRLATRILSHHGEKRGLQMTIAVLDASLKYPWVAGDPHAPRREVWSVNPTETDDLEEIRGELPCSFRYQQTLEAQIMDWADDVAYSVHDLDDWNRAGYMPLTRLALEKAEQEHFVEFVISRRASDNPDVLHTRLAALLRDPDGPFEQFRIEHAAAKPIFDANSGAARRAIRRLRGNVFGDAMTRFRIGIRPGLDPDDPALDIPRRYVFEFKPDESAQFKVSVLKELLWMYVVDDARMATQQHGHRKVIMGLMDALQEAARRSELRLFPQDRRRYMAKKTSEPLEYLRTVADYVCGLTDADALRLYERLQSGGAGLHHYA